MEKGGNDSSTGFEKLAVGVATVLAFAVEIFRGFGEKIGSVKDKQSEKTHMEPTNNSDVSVDLARADMTGWDGAPLKRAAITAIILYAQMTQKVELLFAKGAQKIERGIGNLDRLAGIEKNEKYKALTRVIFAIAIAIIPGAILGFADGSPAGIANQAQSRKPLEKPPAPRKTGGYDVHANDEFYRIAFAKPPQRNTFVVAQPPMKRQNDAKLS